MSEQLHTGPWGKKRTLEVLAFNVLPPATHTRHTDFATSVPVADFPGIVNITLKHNLTSQQDKQWLMTENTLKEVLDHNNASGLKMVTQGQKATCKR